MSRVLPKNNPFRVACQESIPWLSHDGTSIEQIYQRLVCANRCGAIVGPKGTGKTTLLLAIGQQLTATGFSTRHVTFSRCHQTRRQQLEECRESIISGELLLIDGAERLSPWSRNRLFRSARRFSGKPGSTAGLIATLHWKPWFLRTVFRSKCHEELLLQVLKHLEKNDQSTTSAAKTLFVKNRGNMRLVLRGLYDQYAQPNELADDRFALKSPSPRRKSRGHYAQR